MRRQLFILTFLFATILANGQNIQTHYDLGEDREYLTTTVEMFKPDAWGSTFFFIDFDYGVNGNEGASTAYFEIARGLKFWDNPFELHVEYNGGFGQFEATPFNGAYQINDAWLIGGNYTFANTDFSKIFTLQAMYKNIRNKDDASFQITGVWNLTYLDGKITLSGFADFWKEKSKHGDYIFISEPQFWYNLTKKFSLGSEVELSNNFADHDGFMVNPTIAAKWNF